MDMLTWGTYPAGIDEEMIQSRRRIKRERELAVHRQERAKRELITYTIYGTILALMLAGLWWMTGLLIEMWPKS